MSPTQAPLRQLTFSVAAGTATVLIGSDEGGKTTLMRAVLGLLTPEAGRISVFGAPPRRGQPAIGYVPQAPFVLPGSIREKSTPWAATMSSMARTVRTF